MIKKNIIQRLRTDSSMISWQTATEAATKIERMREVGDCLVECLEWAMVGREKPEDMLDAIAVWTEEYSHD